MTGMGILLVMDEVQSGFGRTGKMFAVEHYGVRPDIVVMAKGIANGFPLSGIASRKELMDMQKPGSMGGTYAGNAVSCAAGIAVAKTFKEEKILDNVNARGKEMKSMLDGLKSDSKTGKIIYDVRGLGLMLAMEFSAWWRLCVEGAGQVYGERHVGIDDEYFTTRSDSYHRSTSRQKTWRRGARSSRPPLRM